MHFVALSKMGCLVSGKPTRARFRRDWAQRTAREAQVVAAQVLENANVLDAVGTLTAKIDPPAGPLERVFAAHVLQRTAWELLRAAVRGGVMTYPEAHQEFARIMQISERGEWSTVPARLREHEPGRRTRALALRIREYVDGHLGGAPILSKIGRAVGASVRVGTAEFRRQYGISIHEYATRRRLTEATRLLITTDMKVSAVASNVGFRDKSSLYRLFAKVVGVTPEGIRRDPHSARELKKRLQVPVARNASD